MKHTLRPLAIALSCVGALAAPARADVVVTHARDFGFFANWGNVSTPCASDPSRFQYIFASLNFFENSTSLDGSPLSVGVLNLSFANDCPESDNLVGFSAGGLTDPLEYPFAWDFQQTFTLDKKVGPNNILAYATYSASIPLYVETHGCYVLATVNVRLDAQAAPDTFHTNTHVNEGDTLFVDFFRVTNRVAAPSGTISISPLPGEAPCNVGTLPPNFAIYPQTTFSDGSPATFNYKTQDAQITRTRP